MRILFAAGILFAAFASTAIAQADATSRSWNQPVEPFRIIDNIYYVGASGVTAFLISSQAGHIVTDGGFAETAPMILENIRKLGFKPGDVKVLLNSHAHYDHSGGLAALKAATGARMFAAPGDAQLLRDGGRGDFRFGESPGFRFPAVEVDSSLRDRQVIKVGSTTLTVHLTPGHTRGCTSWSMTVRDGNRAVPVLFVCSTSILDYKFVGSESYPGIAADFERTFTRLKSLPCNVLLAPHADFFEMTAKRSKIGQGSPNPFIDAELCTRYLTRQEKAFRDALARQRGSQ